MMKAKKLKSVMHSIIKNAIVEGNVLNIHPLHNM